MGVIVLIALLVMLPFRKKIMAKVLEQGDV